MLVARKKMTQIPLFGIARKCNRSIRHLDKLNIPETAAQSSVCGNERIAPAAVTSRSGHIPPECYKSCPITQNRRHPSCHVGHRKKNYSGDFFPFNKIVS